MDISDTKIFSRKWNFDESKLKPDCEVCDSLCCVAPKFGVPGYEKPAGQVCRNLNVDAHRCHIFDHLEDDGFGFCREFDCLGAGVAVSNVFRSLERTWTTDETAGKAELDVFTFVFGFLCWYKDPDGHPGVNFEQSKFDLLENFIEAALAELTYDVDEIKKNLGEV